MKKVLILVGIAIVLVLAFLFFSKPSTPQGSVGYTTTTLAPTTISTNITATGTVEPIIQVEVGTQVSGIISKIYVDFNSEVEEGQLLAELDRSVLETELEASEATLNSAKNEYDYQKKNFERTKGLYEKQLISTTEYETAEYQYHQAEFTYNQSKANIQKAEKNLGYTRIYSPINGVVLSREVDEGQTVASGYSTPTLFTIANDLRKMQVIADIDEADIGEVNEGQSVSFTVDAYPDDLFAGEVTQVRLQATTTSNVVTYEVVIDAPNPDLKLKPGLTANVTINTLNKENILAVPVRALRFTPQGAESESIDAKRVWLQLPDGSLSPKDVVTGVSDGIQTEIVSGLQAGDNVITGIRSQSALQSGENQSESNNPFMPPRPGNGDNVRTK